jgi:hypothetical protein
MALDAGIQYNASTSPKIAYRNLHFGISLRNIGTPLQFRGDGLSFLGTSQNGNYSQTQQMRSANFELPSQLNIGASFDHKSKDEQMRLTIAGAFISNSFTQDQLGLGAQFAYREQFIIHAGYRYEKNIFSSENRSNVYTGLSAGFTFEVPLRKDGTKFGIDYSYRTTNPFYGTHSLGVRISL